MPSALDEAVVKLLGINAKRAHVSSAGGGGCSAARTSKLTTTLDNGETQEFFIKSSQAQTAEVMFRGEHASLQAIHRLIPDFCPKSYGHGRCEDNDTAFLVTDFIDLISPSVGSAKSPSLAQKLAKLHSTAIPIPGGHDTPQFGFHVTTCCGDTPQDNTFESSWAKFYADRRLRFITTQTEIKYGPDQKLSELIEETCDQVVPRLLADSHVNGGKGISPALIHGDLWSGNASSGRLPGIQEPEQLVFDPCACYAHSEFELGIMKLFGGFGTDFFDEYHALIPKTEPADEYDDRIRLYKLYHQLNHYAMFGGGYRRSAIANMEDLLAKYGH